MIDQIIDGESIEIKVGDVILKGLLSIPAEAEGIIIFAHGSGSGRFSPRNQYIANELVRVKFATFLFDLLSAEEDEVDLITTQFRFNIPFLAERLISVTEWMSQQKNLTNLPVGYFGASTGAGAALVAAAYFKHHIHAVVSRGGRPDLAGDALTEVTAPTLLIVGGEDSEVIDLNKQALDRMHCHKKMTIVPGATHLFEEPGALAQVALLANAWFKKNITAVKK